MDVTQAPPAALQKLRGGDAGMIFQEPMTSLNPLQRIGKQVAEAMTLHGKFSRAGVRQKVVALLQGSGASRCRAACSTTIRTGFPAASASA